MRQKRSFWNAIMMISAFTFRWKKFLKEKKCSSSENSQKWFVSRTLSQVYTDQKKRFKTDSSPEPMYEVSDCFMSDSKTI